MPFFVDIRFPSIPSCHMFVQRPFLPFLPVEILTVGSVRNGVVGPEKSTCTKLGQEELGNVLERRGKESVCLV